MGEAKRRNKQGQQIEEALRRRANDGEFGATGEARRYCVVLDKSPRGRDMLSTLRSTQALGDVAPLLEGAALQLWEASALFRFAVLCGGAGTPDMRTLLAADIDKLVNDVLPRAWKRQQAAGSSPGVVIAVGDEFQGRVQGAVEQLQAASDASPARS